MTVDVFSAHRHDERIVLDRNRTAVVVIDMINEFCKPGGKMVLPGYETLVRPQRAVIEAARASNVPLVWVHDAHRSNVRRDREWVKRTPHSVEGTWATEIIADLDARADEIHVIKRRYSAFFQTDLDLTLKDMMVDQLVVFGVVTNICVRSTVHDAFFNGYEVVVPEDCCAATGQREQESSLYDIATHFGVVSDAAAVVAALRTGGALENRDLAGLEPRLNARSGRMGPLFEPGSSAFRRKDNDVQLGKAPLLARPARGPGATDAEPLSDQPRTTGSAAARHDGAGDGVSAAPVLSRAEILAYHARTGYSLEHHPAHLLRRAHQRATATFQEVLSDDDLTPTQHAALASVLKHGELSQNHLGRLTAMDPSTISLVVRALLKRGLITRRPSETDQRLSMIALTDAGVRYTLERLDASMRVARRLLEPLSAPEQATLLDLLRRITADDEAPVA